MCFCVCVHGESRATFGAWLYHYMSCLSVLVLARDRAGSTLNVGLEGSSFKQVKPATSAFFATRGQQKQVVNTTLTDHYLLSCYDEPVSKQLLIYTSRSYVSVSGH